jgi:transposase
LRSDAARIGGVGLQTIRDWGAAGPEGLKDGKAPGQPSLLKDEHRRALAQKVEDGPNPAADGMVRWRLIDLARWIFEEYRISVTKQILSRELHAMGYRKLLARPRHHVQDAAAVAAFKNVWRGISYLRKLLIHGARAVLPTLSKSATPLGGGVRALLARVHKNVTKANDVCEWWKRDGLTVDRRFGTLV